MDSKIQTITTADQLYQASSNLGPCELVKGVLIMMTPAGFGHGRIENKILVPMTIFADSHELGIVCPGDTGFIIERNPDTVRAPDVAFVRIARIPSVEPQGYFPGPPDLAVEIRSANDRPSEIEAKIQEYLTAGSIVVWDVDPATKTVTVIRRGTDRAVYGEDNVITEEELLPGFALKVKDIFK